MVASFSRLWHKVTQAVGNLGNHEALGKLGDFTTGPRVILISCMAVGIGIISAFVAYPDESLRAVVYRMAETGFTRLPVVERDDPRKLVGMVSLNDLLKARVRNLEEERYRERVLRLRLLSPARTRDKINQQ